MRAGPPASRPSTHAIAAGSGAVPGTGGGDGAGARKRSSTDLSRPSLSGAAGQRLSLQRRLSSASHEDGPGNKRHSLVGASGERLSMTMHEQRGSLTVRRSVFDLQGEGKHHKNSFVPTLAAASEPPAPQKPHHAVAPPPPPPPPPPPARRRLDSTIRDALKSTPALRRVEPAAKKVDLRSALMGAIKDGGAKLQKVEPKQIAPKVVCFSSYLPPRLALGLVPPPSVSPPSPPPPIHL
jgi:hypothetical protein